MTDLANPMRYDDLDNFGHLHFTSPPLKAPLELTGWVEVSLWLESCDHEADLFCYLESFDPAYCVIPKTPTHFPPDQSHSFPHPTTQTPAISRQFTFLLILLHPVQRHDKFSGSRIRDGRTKWLEISVSQIVLTHLNAVIPNLPSFLLHPAPFIHSTPPILHA
jgi:hypothetical protein